MRNPSQITNVYVYPNGMCMVFDQYGQQMPDYQGVYEEVKDSIERDRPKDVEIAHGEWRR